MLSFQWASKWPGELESLSYEVWTKARASAFLKCIPGNCKAHPPVENSAEIQRATEVCGVRESPIIKEELLED